MKVLILNGSPRHSGNTRSALQVMKAELEKEHTVEFLDVCNLHLSGCVACDGCKKNGGHCVRPDDSDQVIQKVVAADVVLFGTPVYWWGMSAQLKMLVDKFYSQDGPFKTMPKTIGLLTVGANGVDNPQYRLIREQFQCIAEYLHWKFAFSLEFSAYAPGELMEQPQTLEQLQKACGLLVK